jgi:hypothetical protein
LDVQIILLFAQLVKLNGLARLQDAELLSHRLHADLELGEGSILLRVHQLFMLTDHVEHVGVEGSVLSHLVAEDLHLLLALTHIGGAVVVILTLQFVELLDQVLKFGL